MGIKSDIIKTWDFKSGKLNKITDVPGVKVGHFTIKDKINQTGVTAIIPHEGDVFNEKLLCSCEVINGYGKSTGLIQLEELGLLEAPIMMTNTMSVGDVLSGTNKYMISKYENIGKKSPAPNIIVTECNDGVINDMRSMAIKDIHATRAILNATEDFSEGSVGAGTGMITMSLKGGIGSSSRVLNILDKDYTLGSIVLSNFGRIKDLKIDGRKIGREMYESFKNKEIEREKGSIIIVIATDIPLSNIQLKRVSKRATVALANVGSIIGSGSGDIAITFSTANKIIDEDFHNIKYISDEHINDVFRASIESIEESVLSALFHAETVKLSSGKTIYSLKDNLKNSKLKL
ncbi:P1 family peptidase [Peptoniphilus sp.]|jgi:D-aminopeptidase|uniref:P1 family peptidase n=1 Tax=Peptoniphilus sp. TaxID=1971214 RepID=UPI003D8DCADF